MKRRHAFQTVTVFLLIGTALLALGPLRQLISRRVEAFRETALGQIERVLGRKVTYKSISPSILSFLSVRGLTVHGAAGEPRELLTVDRLRLYYRPIRLLQGRFTEAFSQIAIVNSQMTIDTRTDAPYVELIESLLEQDNGAEAVLPDELSIGARNLDVEVIAEEASLAVKDLFFDVSLADAFVDLTARGQVIASSLQNAAALGEVVGRVEVSGSVNLETGSTLMDIDLDEVNSDLASIEDVVMQLRLADGVVEARNVQSRAPVDIYFRHDLESQVSYGRILADGFELSTIAGLTGPLASLDPLLSFPIRGQASVTVSPETLAFGVSLNAQTYRVGPLPPGNLTVQMDGNSREVDVDRLTFESDEGSVGYDGLVSLEPLRPRGLLTVDSLSLGDTEPFSTTVTFGGPPEQLEVRSEPFAVNDVPVQELGFLLRYDEPAESLFRISIGAADPSLIEIESLHSSDALLQEASFSVSRLRWDDVARIYGAVFPNQNLPSFQLIGFSPALDAAGRFDSQESLFEISDLTVYDRDNPMERVSVSGTYSQGELVVPRVIGKLGDITGTGSVEGSFSGTRVSEFSGRFVVSGIPYEFTGSYSPSREIEITGQRGATFAARLPENGAISFDASGRFPLPAPRGRVGSAAFDVDGFFQSATSFALSIDELGIEGVSLGPVDNATISLVAEMDGQGVEVESISFADRFALLRGAGSAVWNLEEPSADLSLVINDVSGRSSESYSVTGTFDQTGVEMEYELESVPLARFGIASLSGELNASGDITGTISDPQLTADIGLTGAEFNNDALEFAADVTASTTALAVVQASARMGRTRLEGFEGGINTRSGDIALAGELLLAREGGAVMIDVSADGRFRTINSFAEILSAPLDADVVIRGIPSESENEQDWILSVARDAQFTRIAGGPSQAVEFEISRDGEFSAEIGGSLPVSFRALGFLSSGTLEADLIEISGDVPRLWSVLGESPVTFSAGRATGSLRIVGPLNDPDFYGTIVGRDIVGSAEMSPAQLGPVRVFVVLEEKIITMREALVPAGTTEVHVGAQIVLDRWGVEQYRIDVRTMQDEAVPVVDTFGPVEVDGLVIGDLTIAGDQVSSSISGDLRASSTTIALGQQSSPVQPGAQSRNVTVDIAIETGRGVEFLWPNANIPILRGFAAVGESVDIEVQTGTGTFGVDGNIGIQGGEIFYFDRSFYITEGEITFDETQRGFDPRLSVNAEIREISEEGPVRIYLVAEEKPLSQFSPQWRSDPPLSEAAILSILGGTVFVGESGEPIDLSQAVLLTSDFVSQFGLIRNFERGVRDALQLDLFSIRTQLFQNLLRGVIDQNSSVPLDTAVPSLGQYLDNTTLFAGRYLGTDLFLELLVQVSESEPESSAQQSLTGIEIDSEVSLEWETPFFQLEWAFFPRDPSTLFLTDNTIRFSWDFSY